MQNTKLQFETDDFLPSYEVKRRQGNEIKRTRAELRNTRLASKRIYVRDWIIAVAKQLPKLYTKDNRELNHLDEMKAVWEDKTITSNEAMKIINKYINTVVSLYKKQVEEFQAAVKEKVRREVEAKKKEAAVDVDVEILPDTKTKNEKQGKVSTETKKPAKRKRTTKTKKAEK